MRRVDNPAELATVFAEDREAHIYGLADLEEPFWSNSTWYREGPAVIGLVSTGGAWVTAYAMSRHEPEATLSLLADLITSMPAGTWITGPTGMYRTVSRLRAARDMGPHWRMILQETAEEEAASDAVPLGPADREALIQLHTSDEGSAFFLPMMLERNPFMGIWEDGQLVASAGTHALSRRYGVAAIGAVITRPSHRGRGLAAQVLGALCRRLASEYETIGLNVETANKVALRLYDRLGFRVAFQYEETEVL